MSDSLDDEPVNPYVPQVNHFQPGVFFYDFLNELGGEHLANEVKKDMELWMKYRSVKYFYSIALHSLSYVGHRGTEYDDVERVSNLFSADIAVISKELCDVKKKGVSDIAVARVMNKFYRLVYDNIQYIGLLYKLTADHMNSVKPQVQENIDVNEPADSYVPVMEITVKSDLDKLLERKAANAPAPSIPPPPPLMLSRRLSAIPPAKKIPLHVSISPTLSEIANAPENVFTSDQFANDVVRTASTP